MQSGAIHIQPPRGRDRRFAVYHATPLKTFIIYASKDKDLREELERHLRPLADLGWLEVWSDKEIMPGERWDAAIKKNLLQAELFLMLVSVDFYNSGYIREEEFKTAIARLESGDALIIPIIVRHCTWKFYPVIKDLQVLPPGGVAVNDRAYWQHRDKAWDAVVEKIGARVQGILEERNAAHEKTDNKAKPAAEKQVPDEAEKERQRQAEERKEDYIRRYKMPNPYDLKIVVGIGPNIEQILKESGIKNWNELASTSVARLREILDAAGSRYQLHDPSPWPIQAEFAVAKKWEELKNYQEKLLGGREVTE